MMGRTYGCRQIFLLKIEEFGGDKLIKVWCYNTFIKIKMYFDNTFIKINLQNWNLNINFAAVKPLISTLCIEKR